MGRVTPNDIQTGSKGSWRERLDRGESFRVLSIDGGGFLGLASAAFINGIERHFGASFHERFDLFCGTSTGAIIALALALGRSGAEIVSLYDELGAKVFTRRGLGFFFAKYRNKALRGALSSQFGSTTLGDLHAKNKAVLITAFNVTSGTPRCFKTNHSPNLTRDASLQITDVAMASTAAPYYFPVVRITNPHDELTESFCDGGVVANHPALLGFVEALSEFQARSTQISVLSISTPRTKIGEGAASTLPLNRGIVRWRKTLPSIFIDANSLIAHELLRRLVASYPKETRPRYERVEMINEDRLEMDDSSPRAKASLNHLGRTHAASNETRHRVKNILGES